MSVDLVTGMKVTWSPGRRRTYIAVFQGYDGDRAVILAGGFIERVDPTAIQLYREVKRTWRLNHLPTGTAGQLVPQTRVLVETVHPQHGRIPRGTLTRLRSGAWQIVDAEFNDLGAHEVDYLDAERILFDATSGLDELDRDELL